MNRRKNKQDSLTNVLLTILMDPREIEMLQCVQDNQQDKYLSK